MIDRNLMVDGPTNTGGEPPTDGLNHPSEPLEHRVQRLEDAVAALQDTHLMEERITERVLGTVNRKPRREDARIVEAERRTTAPPVNTNLPTLPLPESTPAPQPPPVPEKSSWVVVEGFRDIRTTLRMFFDSRYRVSWWAYFALMALAYVLVSYWLWGVIPIISILSGPTNIPFLGNILDKTLDLILALFAFKTLGREIRRYRAAVAGQAAYQQY